jgi:sugar phosphate isomerase/epimerase
MRDLSGRLDLCAINTATLGFQTEIEETIDAVAGAGFGSICPWRRELDGKSVTAVARQIRDAGLAVSGYCRSTYLPAMSREQFDANIEDNRRAIDQSAELGAACFVMVVGSLPEGSRDLAGAREQIAEGTAQLLEHARKAGTRLALEPLHPMYANDRSCLNTLEQALDLAEAIEPDAHDNPSPGPSLGVAVDLYHVWWDPKLEAQIERAGRARRIFGFHVCDWLVPTRDMLNDRGMMGDGVIDIARSRGLVEAAGYDGAVEVEIFSSGNWWTKPVGDTLKVCAERFQTVC